MERNIKMNNIQTVIFHIQGKRPEPAEAERLSALSFGSGLPGGAEIKDALKWFGIGLLSAVILFLFGRWVISRFVGPGVLVFGYGAAYLAAPVLVIFGFSSLFKLLRPAHKKKAAGAFQWAWMVSVLGEDAVGERFGKLPYLLSTMRRLLPEGTDFDPAVFEEYVADLRAAMAEAADETTAELRTGGWHESSPNKSCRIIDEKELSPNLRELNAVINYNDQLALTDNNNKTRYMTSAMLELHITQYYIRSGKYWFPYDVTPAFERAETAEAAKSA